LPLLLAAVVASPLLPSLLLLLPLPSSLTSMPSGHATSIRPCCTCVQISSSMVLFYAQHASTADRTQSAAHNAHLQAECGRVKRCVEDEREAVALCGSTKERWQNMAQQQSDVKETDGSVE
jgi:hypothetical protein